MTDKQKLEAIKAEIERRKNETFLNANFNECKQFILNELQKFIASLDEQSDNCDTTNDKDYTKSNEEKAKEICGKGNPCCNKLCQNCCLSFVIADVKQMAEWKDEQFKQDLDNAFKSADHVQYTNGYNDAVEKAWQYIKENYGGDYASETLVSECKKIFVEYMQEGEK